MKPFNRQLFFILYLAIFTSISGCENDAHLAPLSTDAKIMAFGDSLTYGTGAPQNQSYPAHLQKFSHHTVINTGIPGEISKRGLQRLPSLLAHYQPELIIICHGANDILRKLNLEQTKKNIQKMIDLANAQGVQVMLIDVPEFSIFLSPHPLYEELAETNQLPLVRDALTDILRDNNLKSDQIHPNALGYQQLANRVFLQLQTSGAL